MSSIEFLKQYLRNTVSNSARSRKKSPPPLSEDEDTPSDGEFVAVISGGLASRGPMNQRRQDYERNSEQKSTNNLGDIPHIEVSKANYRGSTILYDDGPLSVEIKVENLKVKRVLIGIGSSSDIISLQNLKNLQHDPSTIADVHSPLFSFGGSIIHPISAIFLLVQIG